MIGTTEEQKEKNRARAKKWAQGNKERNRKRANEWYHANKEHASQTNKKWKADNKDKCYKHNKDWEERHPEQNKAVRNAKQKRRHRRMPAEQMFYRSRLSAKRRGLDFNITIDDIVIPKICPALGIPLFVSEGKLGPNSPSMDRIDNSKGYVKGNVWVISHRANTIKNSANVEELFMIARAVKEKLE